MAATGPKTFCGRVGDAVDAGHVGQELEDPMRVAHVGCVVLAVQVEVVRYVLQSQRVPQTAAVAEQSPATFAVRHSRAASAAAEAAAEGATEGAACFPFTTKALRAGHGSSSMLVAPAGGAAAAVEGPVEV